MLNIHTNLLEAGLTAPEISVLIHIAKRTNGIKVAFPSRDLLKKETKLGREALAKAIKGLITRGIISAEQEKPKGGKFGKTIYTLLSKEISSYHGDKEKNRTTENRTTDKEKQDRDTENRSTANRSTENSTLSISNSKELENLIKEKKILKKKIQTLKALLAKKNKGSELLKVLEYPENWSDELKSQVSQFFAYRVEIKKPYNSLISLKARIKKFSNEVETFTESVTIGAIEETISSSWQGVNIQRYIDNNPTGNKTTKPQPIDTHTLPPALEQLYKKGLEKYNKKEVSQRIAYFTKKEFQSWMKGGVNFEKHRDRGILTEPAIYKKITETISKLNTDSFYTKKTGNLIDYVNRSFEGKVKQIG